MDQCKERAKVRRQFEAENPERIGWLDSYSPPLPVPIREVWMDGKLVAITSQAAMLLDVKPLMSMVAVRYLSCGDTLAVRYNGTTYWDALWLREQFPGASDAIRDFAIRCCNVRGWRPQHERGGQRKVRWSGVVTRRSVLMGRRAIKM